MPVTACAVTDDLTGLPVSLEFCGLPSNGGFTADTVGLCITYTPNIGFESGTDQMCVIVCDNNGLCDTTVIIITVEPFYRTYGYHFCQFLPDTPVPVCVFTEEMPGDIVGIGICEEPSNGVLNVTGTDTCVQYVPQAGFTGQDTMCVVLCNSFGLCDTTIIIVHITEDTCGTPVDSLTLEAPSCDQSAQLCLDIPFTEIGDYEIYDSGQLYDDNVLGCAFDTMYLYMYSLLPGLGNSGPYFIDEWLINGSGYSGQFQNAEDLVDSMNTWDPAGSWLLNNSNFTINGGLPSNNYGVISITQLNSGIISNLELNVIMTPNGSAVLLDTGEHLVEVFPEGEDCPILRYFVTVTCDSTFVCPDLYTGPASVEIQDCDELASVCLDIEPEDIDDYIVFDNGALYTGDLLGCDNDTLSSYSYFTLYVNHPAGPYVLDSWTVNSDVFSGGFPDMDALTDSMNLWDPQGQLVPRYGYLYHQWRK